MTLRERNLVIEQLKYAFSAKLARGVETKEVEHALMVMQRQPLSSPGLPVSAGGDPEEPRYCVECGEPVLDGNLTCGKLLCAMKQNRPEDEGAWRGK